MTLGDVYRQIKIKLVKVVVAELAHKKSMKIKAGVKFDRPISRQAHRKGQGLHRGHKHSYGAPTLNHARMQILIHKSIANLLT